MEASNHLLVVDDDIVFLKVMEEILKEYYEVSLAKSGQQAVRFLEKGKQPDMILLDIDMPDMDGFETLLNLNKLSRKEKIPVIYLTGMDGTDSEAYGLRLGAVDYIRKPVVKDVLLARLSIHLSHARSRRELAVLKQNQVKAETVQLENLQQMERILTKTEIAVAMLVVQGYTNEEAGRKLNYSPAYIKKVVSRIFARLNINNRREIKHCFCSPQDTDSIDQGLQ